MVVVKAARSAKALFHKKDKMQRHHMADGDWKFNVGARNAKKMVSQAPFNKNNEATSVFYASFV